MDKKFTLIFKSVAIGSALMGIVSSETIAQSIYSNNIDGTNPSSSADPFVAGQVSDPNITGLGVFRIGVGANPANNRYNTNSWSNIVDMGKYINVKFVVNEGYQLDLDSMIVTVQRSDNGPDSVQFRSNHDGYVTVLGRSGVTTSSTTGKIRHEFNSEFSALTDTVEFRYYFYDATSGAAGINDFIFKGTVTPIPASDPTIEITTYPDVVCSDNYFNINFAATDVPEGASYWVSVAYVGTTDFFDSEMDLNEEGNAAVLLAPEVSEPESYQVRLGVEVEGVKTYSDPIIVDFYPITYSTDAFTGNISVPAGELVQLMSPGSCEIFGGIQSVDPIESFDVNIYSSAAPEYFNGAPYIGKYFNFNSSTNPDATYTAYMFLSQDEIDAYNALPEVNEEGLYFPIFIDESGSSNLQFTVFHGEPSVGGDGPLGYDSVGKYVITPDNVTFDASSNLYLVQFTMTGFSGVFPHTNAVSAPLNSIFGDITATANQSGHNITFTTLSEENGSKFELLSSNDGVNFNVINAIQGNGKPSQYSLLDANKSGTFYQIRMIQNGGQSVLSKVVRVNSIFENNTITIAPNPVNDQFTLNLPKGVHENASLQIIDALGRVVYSTNVTTNQMVISTSNWSSGLYRLVVNNDGKIESINFVKK